MADTVKSIVSGYNYVFYDLTSPISRDWFLVARPYQLICLLGFYLYFCTRFGPRFMKYQNPYNVTNAMIIHNLFQIILSIYIIFLSTWYILLTNFNFNCQGRVSDPAIAKWVAGGVWTYYMIKITELLDTVFFVLRKSNRQISSLHLHHHTLMPIASWFGTTYYPGGQGILIGFVNAIVHLVMYTYYLMAGFGEKYKKNLWWKKHVTILQLTQFVVLAIHSINSLFYTCDYFLIFKILTIFYAFFFIYMFGKFYYNTYIKKTK